MAERRMDLNEAGELLGISANAVRARWKKNQIKGERDNSQKIWVYLDPDKAANDRPKIEPSLKASMKPSFEVQNQPLIEAFESHISTLKAENEGLKSEKADLLRRLDVSEEERRNLLTALLDRPPPTPLVAPQTRKRGWWPFGSSND